MRKFGNRVSSPLKKKDGIPGFEGVVLFHSLLMFSKLYE